MQVVDYKSLDVLAFGGHYCCNMFILFRLLQYLAIFLEGGKGEGTRWGTDRAPSRLGNCRSNSNYDCATVEGYFLKWAYPGCEDGANFSTDLRPTSLRAEQVAEKKAAFAFNR